MTSSAPGSQSATADPPARTRGGQDDRQARLARALRQNLLRRKMADKPDPKRDNPQ